MDYKKISLGLLIVAVVLLVGLILTYLKMQSLSAVKIDKASQVNSASDLEAMSALDQPQKEKGAKVIAKIGKREITLTELEGEIQKLPPQISVNFKDKKQRVEFLRQYIGLLLLYDQAIKKGLDRDPEVLKQTLETKKGLVVDKYLASEIPMPQVTEAEMKLFYGMNKEQLQGIKFEEIKDKIEFELIQQKRREAYKSLVAKLTQAEKVEIFEDKL
ncbi:MAG: hypothetical protein RBG1_1C00001G1777 [candidate division Zixibacteria bacterium RBG-1]|nr:MAG: hypothetical protein RBG1_1C00001G1777 [candidate division Zixibacteria bacterium RBG-1]OGC84173.1 MAG: hypothetical protein A2V73_08875 [candidate division Zixibacteria bacterium RBG_19FT_COMBO_42_43]